MSTDRDWLLVAPWYRWRRQGLPARETRPVLQKYDTSDPVSAFQKDPQHSLKFTDEDLIHSIVKAPDLPALASPMQSLQRRLSPLTRVPTDLRKVYLDSHRRFYLVVAELHADDPGFPCVDRRSVCEAGFVIRRRQMDYPAAAEEEVRQILRDLGDAAAGVGASRRRAGAPRLVIVDDARADGAGIDESDGLGAAVRRRQEDVAAERERLAEWAARVGARRLSMGWVPDSGIAGVGEWRDLPEQPQVLTESTVRLFPYVPPADTEATAGTTLYFGLLPTGGSDTTAHGEARFDDTSLYEVRCYVRRHDPRCPRTAQPGDCKGELVWSRPTEPYRLAPQFDLAGTGNRPVTVQLPDLQALEAEAAALPVGRAAPFRLKAPDKSSLDVDIDASFKPMNPTRGQAICSFAIPLITIVATFVFKLFLPVVVILFQLWFLLKLKFCIPPSVEVDAALDLALEASADVELDVGVQAKLGAELERNIGTGAGAKLTGTYSNGVLVQMRSDLQGTTALTAPSFAADLEFEEPEARLAVGAR